MRRSNINLSLINNRSKIDEVGVAILGRKVVFVVNDSLKPGYEYEEMSQLLIAPLICKLLGIEKSKKMRSLILHF